MFFPSENNHAPYTAAKVYTDRYPELQEGSMQQIYNSNMAAVDDAIGTLRSALSAAAHVFENRTLIIFSQDNASSHVYDAKLLVD